MFSNFCCSFSAWETGRHHEGKKEDRRNARVWKENRERQGVGETHATSPHRGVNLKIKAEVRGNKHLSEIQKNSESGSVDSGRNLDSIPVRSQRQGVFMGKGRGAIPSVEGRRFSGCGSASAVILKDVFNFQSSSHHICCPVPLAKSCWDHRAALGPAQRSSCPVLTVQSVDE